MTFVKEMPLLILVLVSVSSCSQLQKSSLAEEKEKILALHNAQRDYHFHKDSIAFVNQLSNDFISVNKGKISYQKREETLARYNRYFSSVEFVKWDDVAEPIIRLSDDGTMAYAVIDKMVVVKYNNENGETVEGKTHFAWTAIYRKLDGEWRIDCVTSTDEPARP